MFKRLLNDLFTNGQFLNVYILISIIILISLFILGIFVLIYRSPNSVSKDNDESSLYIESPSPPKYIRLFEHIPHYQPPIYCV